MFLKRLAKVWALVLGIILLLFSWHHTNERRMKGIIWSDQEGYYVYLPGLFLYEGFRDMPLHDCCSANPKTKAAITKYPYGIAVLQSPFFGVSHLLAKFNYDPLKGPDNERKWLPNGFSEVYARGIMLATLFYVTIGLYLLGVLIGRRFGALISILATTAVALGTNLFYYTIAEPGMSHGYNFFLFAGFLFLLDHWLKIDSPEKDNLKFALKPVLLGLLFGLIIFSRPTNVLLGLAFFLWEVNSKEGLKSRLKLLWDRRGQLFLMVPVLILVALPQMIYWNFVFNNPFEYSYTGESFIHWNDPFFFSVLFSHQNGLFAYTPILFFFIPGLVLSWRRKDLSAPLVLLLFLIMTYIFSSWWAWWFGGAFGHRCFVEFYVLLSFPIAATFEFIIGVKKNKQPSIIRASMLALIIAIFIFCNAKMTYLYRPPWDGPSWTTERFLDVWKSTFRVWDSWPETH